jgi:hypothetical protein
MLSFMNTVLGLYGNIRIRWAGHLARVGERRNVWQNVLMNGHIENREENRTVTLKWIIEK